MACLSVKYFFFCALCVSSAPLWLKFRHTNHYWATKNCINPTSILKKLAIFALSLQNAHVKQCNGQVPPGINFAYVMDNDHRDGAGGC